MRWPWTSLARLDTAAALYDRRIAEMQDEITWLRTQNQSLTEQLTRVRRHEAGMTETAREPRKQIVPMPDTIKKYVQEVENPSIRREMVTQAYRMNARGTPWDEIERIIMEDEEETVEQA